jgi:hypothetical protein
MYTKPYTLIPHRLQDHNVQKLTKKIFSPAPKGNSRVLKAKKTIFKVNMECASPYSCF